MRTFICFILACTTGVVVPSYVHNVPPNSATSVAIDSDRVLDMSESIQRFRRPSWRDMDGDGLHTRDEVLTARCIRDIRNGVEWTICVDGYLGDLIETDDPAREVHLDHRLPWSFASTSREWSAAALVEFYNDGDNLVITRAPVNLGKGSSMPGDGWCPPVARRFHAERFIATALKWGIPLDDESKKRLDSWMEGKCNV